MKRVYSILVLLALAACNAGMRETNAGIIERRVIAGEGLLIKYSFRAGDETITDSVRTKNKVIPHDSIRVKYSPSDPRKNTLDFD